MTYIPGGSEPRQEPLGQPAYLPSAPPAYPPPPQYGQLPPHFVAPLPPKKRRIGLIVGLVVAGLVAVGGAALVFAAFNGSKPNNTHPTSVLSSPTAEHIKPGQQDLGIAPPAVKIPPDAKGFTIGVTILTKHCFGSAGCNVTFRIDPSYNGADFTRTTTWKIVYQVNGATDAYTGSFTLTGSEASFPNEEMVSTKNSSAALTAVVTNVVED